MNTILAIPIPAKIEKLSFFSGYQLTFIILQLKLTWKKQFVNFKLNQYNFEFHLAQNISNMRITIIVINRVATASLTLPELMAAFHKDTKG